MPDPTPYDEPVDAEIVTADPVPPVTPPTPDYDERGVPSFDHVRAKIEGRHATSQGMTELTAETPEAHTVEEQFAEREQAAKAKLDEIRRSLGR